MRVEITNTDGKCAFKMTIPGDHPDLESRIKQLVNNAISNERARNSQGPQDGSGDNTALGSAFIFRRD